MIEPTIYVIKNPNSRDHEKVFSLRQFSAYELEWFSLRLYRHLRDAGIDVSKISADTAGLVEFGTDLILKIPDDKLKPMLDEMWSLVRYVPGNNPVLERIPLESDIEDVRTIHEIRLALLAMHIGFFLKTKD